MLRRSMPLAVLLSGLLSPVPGARAGEHAHILDSGARQLVELDLETGKRLASLPLEETPGWLDDDGRYVLVLDRGPGEDKEGRNTMPKYSVQLTPPSPHSVPPLLQAFAEWLSRKEYGSLGYFELILEAVPKEWAPEAAKRLARDAFVFVQLGDGSMLALMETGRPQPKAVVLLGSEGETDVVADSLEEFLLLLGQGETGVGDLDEEEAIGRKALRAWLKERGVSAPRVEQRFDLDAYLEGQEPAPPPAPAAQKSQIVAGLPRFLHRLVSLVGRRADDPELVAFTEELGKKVPGSTTFEMKYVVAPKQGLELGFEHLVQHDDYPPVAKTKASFIPYLTTVWLRKKPPDGLPFGLELDMSDSEMTKRLGAPNRSGIFFDERKHYWVKPLDPARAIVLRLRGGSPITLQIDDALPLSEHGVPGRLEVGLFVAWAIRRGLLDGARFPSQQELIKEIAGGKARGSAFVDAALPRGLWDDHLKDADDLREFAYAYFNNLPWAKAYLIEDLISCFGARKGPQGHDDPRLDADDEAAFEKVAPVFDQRFAQWLK